MTYEQLVEAIREASEELQQLGQRVANWTDEERERYGELETRLAELEQQREEMDAERQRRAEEQERVQQRMAELQARRSHRVIVRGQSAGTMRAERPPTPHYNLPLRAFRGNSALDDAYDCGLWLQANLFRSTRAADLLERRAPDWLESRDMTEGVNSAGGYTVPQPLSNAIIAVWQEAGVARQLCDVIPMTSDKLDIPKDTAGQTVYYPGEAGAITESQVTFDRVQLSAVKRAVLTQISNELLADSVIGIADYVARRMGHAFAYQQDNELINGNGTSTYGGEVGLISSIGTAGVATQATGNTWAAIVLSDFNAALGKLPSRFANGSLAWLMRREFFFAVVQKLVYAGGGNTVSDIQGGTGTQLFGYPVYFSNHMPAEAATTFAAFFGNWMQAVKCGDRAGVNIQSSEHYAFNADLLTLRGTARYDLNFYEPGDSSNAGAVVALKVGT